MKDQMGTPSLLMEIIQKRLGERADAYRIPPPVFIAMQGELLAFNSEDGVLRARFPVLEKHLNPYGAMQGGIVAAAIDNTLGPLSMLVAPPNVTRRLELKYSRPVTPDLDHITVEARLLERKGQQLKFRAEVRDQEGMLLARARAMHWIIDEADLPDSG
jgi:uncharacterized protein (TIGR00369 family)